MFNRTVPVVNLGQPRESAPLPMPDGALYRHPNPDGTRKSCMSCIMWVSGENRCVIHARDREVPGDFVCGYHVFGVPMEKWMDHPGIMSVTPDISGLRPAGAGVACGNCRFYQDLGNGKGLCHGVSDPETRRPPVPVESRGWCARYEPL